LMSKFTPLPPDGWPIVGGSLTVRGRQERLELLDPLGVLSLVRRVELLETLVRVHLGRCEGRVLEAVEGGIGGAGDLQLRVGGLWLQLHDLLHRRERGRVALLRRRALDAR